MNDIGVVPIKSHPISDMQKFQQPEEQIKIRDKELENADKQLTAVIQEYQKVAQRVDQVRNPTYLGDLHDTLGTLEGQVKSLEKDNKYKVIAQ